MNNEKKYPRLEVIPCFDNDKSWLYLAKGKNTMKCIAMLSKADAIYISGLLSGQVPTVETLETLNIEEAIEVVFQHSFECEKEEGGRVTYCIAQQNGRKFEISVSEVKL